MMMVERMKKQMDNMMNQYQPAPAASYPAPQASQEKPSKVILVKVQPVPMMQPKMDDCIVPVDICNSNMMMPNMMMYGGGGGDR